MDCASTMVALKEKNNAINESTDERFTKFAVIHKFVRRLNEKLPKYQFLTAIPQLISRISHKNVSVKVLLETMIVGVISVYPQQTLWHITAVAKSTLTSRSMRIQSILAKVKSDPVGKKHINLIHQVRSLLIRHKL
jgi:serine/threonine-protein kinase ATR